MPKVQDYAIQLRQTYGIPVPRLTQRYVWKNDAIKAAMAKLEIGHLVRYKNTALATPASYIDEWWYVDGIEHNLAVGATPQTIVTLVPSWVYRNLDKIAWDNFDRADASGDLGKTPNAIVWADDTGMDIVSNKARGNVVSRQLPNLALGSSDVVVNIAISNLTLALVSENGEGGVTWRFTDSNNYWTAFVLPADNLLYVYKYVASIATEVTTAPWIHALTASLMVIAQGNRHRIYVDFRQVLDITDSDLNTNTRVGLRVNSIIAQFDNFYSQAL